MAFNLGFNCLNCFNPGLKALGFQLLELFESISLSKFWLVSNVTPHPYTTAAHYHAALYVQAAVRGFLARYQMRTKLASVDDNGEMLP